MSGIRKAASPRNAPDPMPAAFRAWFEAHGRALAHPPCQWRQRRGGYSFGFRGIHTALTGWVDTWQILIAVDYEGKNWDIIQDFDVSTDQTPRGRWYCERCEDRQHRRYYKTPERLWIAHSFEPMLAWLDEALTPDKILLLRKYGRDTTEALILLHDTAASIDAGISEIRIPLLAPHH